MSKPSYFHNNGTEPLFPLTIGQLVDLAAEKWGDREAVVSVYQNSRYRYREIKEIADRFGARLLSLGLKPKDRLGIWCLNSFELYITYIAAIKAGLIVVLINPSYGSRELLICLTMVQVKALVFAEKCDTRNCYDIIEEVIPELKELRTSAIQFESSNLPDLSHLIFIKEDKYRGAWRFSEIASGTTAKELGELRKVQNLIQPDDGCIILFTSGTTGYPKGALLTHHNVVNNALASGRRLLLSNQHHHWCLCTQFCHASASCVVVVDSLCYGATVVIPGPVFHPLKTLETIQQEQCTIFLASPTLFIDMMTEIKKNDMKLDSLVVAAIGTAPISQKLIRDIFTTFRLQRLNVMYGMTETSPIVFQSLATDNDSQIASTVGSLSEYMEAKVVNSEGKIVPMGTRGELWIRGYSIMQGYWNQDDKTKETITSDGWIKTGDLFILQEDGYGSVVGRLKDMIIRDNVNIFPVEIEEFLMTHPLALEVQVFGVPDPRLGEELCACIRHNKGVVLTEKHITDFCKNEIADFLIPRYFYFTTNFPRTAAGKIDKLLLKKQAIEQMKI